MKEELPPPPRDRMSGRYTASWWRRAIDGPGRYASPPRWRRKGEKARFRRYADTIWNALKAEEDADNDLPEDAMCMMCPDAVECCYQCSEERDPGNPRKLTRGWLVIFYLDHKTWCSHLTEEYGTDSPSHYAHFAWGDHEGDECECITKDWFKGKPEPKWEVEGEE